MANEFIGTLPEGRNPLAEALRGATQGYLTGQELQQQRQQQELQEEELGLRERQMGLEESQFELMEEQEERKVIGAMMDFAQQSYGTPQLKELEKSIEDNPEMLNRIEEYRPEFLRRTDDGNLSVNVPPPEGFQRIIDETPVTYSVRDKYGEVEPMAKPDKVVQSDPDRWEWHYDPQNQQWVGRDVVDNVTERVDAVPEDRIDNSVVTYDTEEGTVSNVFLNARGDVVQEVTGDSPELEKLGLQETQMDKEFSYKYDMAEWEKERAKADRELQKELGLRELDLQEQEQKNVMERFNEELAFKRWDKEADRAMAAEQFAEDHDLETKKVVNAIKQEDRRLDQQFEQLGLEEDQVDLAREELKHRIDMDELQSDRDWKRFLMQYDLEEEITDERVKDIRSQIETRSKQLDLDSEEQKQRFAQADRELALRRQQILNNYALDKERLGLERDRVNLDELRVNTEEQRVQLDERRLDLAEQELQQAANEYQNIRLEVDEETGDLTGAVGEKYVDGELREVNLEDEYPVQALPYIMQYQQMQQGEETEEEIAGSLSMPELASLSSDFIGESNNPQQARKSGAMWAEQFNRLARLKAQGDENYDAEDIPELAGEIAFYADKNGVLPRDEDGNKEWVGNILRGSSAERYKELSKEEFDDEERDLEGDVTADDFMSGSEKLTTDAIIGSAAALGANEREQQGIENLMRDVSNFPSLAQILQMGASVFNPQMWRGLEDEDKETTGILGNLEGTLLGDILSGWGD